MSKGFFTTFLHVPMLRVRSYGSTQEQEAFFKKISVAKYYLIITDVHSKESKKQVFRMYLPVKLANGRLLIIKVKKIHVSNLQYCQFGLHWIISWIWTFSQIIRRFIPWENSLRLFWMTLSEASACVWTFSNNNYTRKSSHPIKLQRLKL